MRVKLTIDTRELEQLFRAKVVEYFNQLYPVPATYTHDTDEAGTLHVEYTRADQRGFDRKVNAFTQAQFKHVIRHLLGESVGAEAHDLTVAFSTNYAMRTDDYPYAKMSLNEKIGLVYAFFLREYGPVACINMDNGYTVPGTLRVFLGVQTVPVLEVEHRRLAEWMERNVPRGA